MPPTPEAVIFDMDDVLCRYDFGTRLARMAQMTGVDAATIERVVFAEGFDARADAGEYTAEAYHREFCRRIGARLSVAQWLEARAASITPDAEVLDMARRVAQRARIALLTNNGPLLEAHIGRVFPQVAELFGEHVYFSCSLGASKPDPRVFAAVVARLGATPGATLFIDDSAEYVGGAVEAGLDTHHFQSAAGLRRALEDRGLIG